MVQESREACHVVCFVVDVGLNNKLLSSPVEQCHCGGISELSGIPGSTGHKSRLGYQQTRKSEVVRFLEPVVTKFVVVVSTDDE